MGSGHAHRRQRRGEGPQVSAGARTVLLTALVLAAVATVVGVVALWPHTQPRTAAGATQFVAAGVSFPHAQVVRAYPVCSRGGVAAGAEADGHACNQVEVRVSAGPDAGRAFRVPVPPDVAQLSLPAGTQVQLIRTPAGSQPVRYSFYTVDRSVPLWLLFGVFLVVVALVARARGLLAVVGLGFGAVVIVRFMLPALLTGASGIGVALAGSSAIMFVVLYLAHGVSVRTSTALAGTLAGIAITAGVAEVAVRGVRLSGVTDESGSLLSSFVGDISFQGLLTCAVIIAGLGVLNDVTITQASAVWELRGADPAMTRRSLFASAMRIGRDHIASTIYTIVFAYAGTALIVLLVFFLYDRPILELMSTEDIAEEITRTLASSIGLVLAVPITTWIATASLAAPSSPPPTRSPRSSSIHEA